MRTYLALIRGINVVGRRTVPMKELKALLEQNGCLDVQTYVQSGNVIFRSRLSEAGRVAKRVAAVVAASRGFEPSVLVLSPGELQQAVTRNPFPDAAANHKTLHVFFLAEAPKRPDMNAIDAIKAASERYALDGRRFYLHTPEGFGPSKLASRAERLLGVDATARNWRTVTTLADMLRRLER
jgi:uncharacterized protein (DUF1697 family)